MKNVLVIFAMITALTMASFGDIPFNTSYAATDSTAVTEEQPEAADDEVIVEDDEVIVEEEEVVVEDEEVTDQEDTETPAE